MNYLERNAEIVTEIRNQSLIRGNVVGHSTKTHTTSVGSYDSEVVGSKLHLALKETHGSVTPEERVTQDIAFASLIYDNIPELQPELPLFIALATEENSQPIGQLTEDFSKGGQFRIRDLFKDEVAKAGSSPQILRQFIGGEHRGLPYLLSDEELMHMFFSVQTGEFEWQRRIGDFDSAWTYMSVWSKPPLDLLRQIESEIDRYTIPCQLKAN